ncbi:hypothetical protein AAMO2058_000329300 [Amorphochlora amoebiformis]
MAADRVVLPLGLAVVLVLLHGISGPNFRASRGYLGCSRLLRLRGGLVESSPPRISGVGERYLIGDILRNAEKFAGTEITVKGWVRSRRTQGKGGSLCFVVLSDGSSTGNLQVISEYNITAGHDDIISSAAGTGAAIAFRGTLVPSPAAGQAYELKARLASVVGGVHIQDNGTETRVYPLAKKHHSLEVLRTLAHLRGRSNLGGAVARVRNVLAKAIHDFLTERQFRYVQTPIITKSDCEGAGEAFSVNHVSSSSLTPSNLTETARKSPENSKYFFGQPAYLTVSGQLNLEALCCSIGNVYCFGPTFRAEKSHTGRHLAEFWMLEPELAFADMNDAISLAEDLIRQMANTVRERCGDEINFLAKFIDKTLPDRLLEMVQTPFARITYSDALILLRNASRKESRGERVMVEEMHWGDDLKTEHERYLAEEVFKRPVIVTNYPKAIKAFYMRQDGTNDTKR